MVQGPWPSTLDHKIVKLKRGTLGLTHLNDSCNNTLGKPEMITLLSPSFSWGVQTRVISASPLYRLTFVILLSVIEASSTTFVLRGGDLAIGERVENGWGLNKREGIQLEAKKGTSFLRFEWTCRVLTTWWDNRGGCNEDRVVCRCHQFPQKMGS